MAAITVPDDDATVAYTIGGTPDDGPFAVPYPFFATSDLVVTTIDADGIVTTLVLDADYTASGTAADDGFSAGSITLTPALQDVDVVIARNTPVEKTQNFPTVGSFNVTSLNTLFSKLFILTQELRRDVDRAFRFPLEATAFDPEIVGATARASKYLGFDADGELTVLSTLTVGALTVSAFIETLLDDANAATARATLGAFDAAGGTITGSILFDAAAYIRLDDSITAAGASLPIAFDGDADLGMYRKAANRAALAVNSTDALIWDTTGVGIGAAPSHPFDVIKSQNADTIARIYNSNAGASARTIMRVAALTKDLDIIAAENAGAPYFQIISDGERYDHATRFVFKTFAGTEIGRIDPTTAGVGAKFPNTLKAWIIVDEALGVLSIEDSFNVSSITDNGVGMLQVNFTNAMPDTTYALLSGGYYVGSVAYFPLIDGASARNTTDCDIAIVSPSNNARADVSNISMAFVGA